MLTERKVLGKLRQIEQRYDALRYTLVEPLTMALWETTEHYRALPPVADPQPIAAGTAWGGDDVTGWFVGEVEIPAACAGQRVFLRALTGGETLFFVDDEPRGVFDSNHPVVMLANSAQAGQRLRVALEAYAGREIPGTQPQETPRRQPGVSRLFERVELVTERADVAAFVFDLRTLNQLFAALGEHSLRRWRILEALRRVFVVVDAMPSERDEASWRPKLAEARELMRPLLALANGPTMPWFGLTGHSHIDTAWLWPLAETWRKCARTFSSVLTLMEQYPEFRFVQSSPCQTAVIRAEYPSLFARIQQAVAAGRWEPNGAMWVEPDCNIPSGESFARQLLVGQQTTRDMFGYTSDTLWLPDVFGYSAALPQLLRLAEVEFFCTTKLGWNDTNRFPYDTFVWHGIDGSAVTAHFHQIDCQPDPATLTRQWEWVQHKDTEDRHYLPYGHGDGGGGPMAEEIEMARRVADLEGCPRTRHMSISEFMQSVRDDLPRLPEWSGELYLELHRGTLTSIAAIKRGNRLAEVALREAEFLASLAWLDGAEYPAGQLRSTWERLLTNQFHDILPGTSIAAVNDEAVADFATCVAEAGSVAEAALGALGAAADGPALLLANSLSWARTGELDLRDVPAGWVPSDCAAQWVEDLDGAARLVASGTSVPPLGTTVLPLVSGQPDAVSAFSVADDRIETPYAVLRLDAAGRIISLLDKASGREVVTPGGALNTFLLGEDLPEAWDNWDIDEDQALKLEPQLDRVSRQVTADGPLQLRVRSEYRLGDQSTLRQDLVLHALTPQIDFDTEVHWCERHRLLKVSFPLAVHTDTARHEIQFGHVTRPTHRNLPTDRSRFEVCAHRWTDLSEAGFGVALLNDCKYGLSTHGSELRLSLIKSGTHPDDRGDAGRHRFSYALLPHGGGFGVESVVRAAYELNTPLSARLAGAQTVGRGSLLTVDAGHVIVDSIKRAEDGAGLVARLYEAGAAGGTVQVHLDPRLTAAWETNLLEEARRQLVLTEASVELAFRPFEVKTLYLRR